MNCLSRLRNDLICFVSVLDTMALTCEYNFFIYTSTIMCMYLYIRRSVGFRFNAIFTLQLLKFNSSEPIAQINSTDPFLLFQEALPQQCLYSRHVVK